MKTNVHDISALRREFDNLSIVFNEVHDDMQSYLDGYEYNFYYAPKPNVTRKNIGVNLVQVFADKLWFHTSEFPKINVPSMPDDDERADIREKILLSTHQENGTDLLWSEWTFDGGVLGACVARTTFDLTQRCVRIQRHDPRRCYWQKSGNGVNSVDVFWTATPMTYEAVKEKYGVDPKGADTMAFDVVQSDDSLIHDGRDYYLVITRDDAEYSCEFVGKMFLKKPYKHLQGCLPVDVAIPYKTAKTQKPKQYLSKLKDLQAEFNELWRRRGNVVRKLGNPLVWGRGIYKGNEQDIREQLSNDGGFVPLKENGEMGLLTIPETRMIDSALLDTFNRMKDVAGFPTATFGEVVGANTSGDALGMYFTPTQKMVTHFNKSYKAFLQGINAKILRLYDVFLKLDEQKELYGYVSQSQLRTLGGETKLTRGNGYSVTFTKDSIAHNYLNVVTPSAVTPKDDIQYKRFILDAVTNKMMSRTTGLDEIGILSPEDEFKRLQQEQQDPMLNPEGATALKAFDPNAQVVNENGQSPFPPTIQPPDKALGV